MKEWLGFQKKDRYIPSQTKRFEISQDDFSRRRIQVLKEIHHKLEDEFRIPFSVSIIGSLVKGKNLTSHIAERADIDMFLDVDVFNIYQNNLDENIIRQRFLSLLEEKKEELSYSTIPTKHITVRVLGNDSISQSLDRYFKPTFFNPKINEKIDIASFFTLSIGSVVKNYRNKFLSKLATMRDQNKAELIWQSIKNSIEEVERRGEIPEQLKKHYPKTLDEALKFYGVK